MISEKMFSPSIIHLKLHINLFNIVFRFDCLLIGIIRQFIFIELPVFNPDYCKGLTLLRAKSIHPFINWTQFCTKWHEVKFPLETCEANKTTWVISVRNLMLHWTQANLIWGLLWFRYDWENRFRNDDCKFLLALCLYLIVLLVILGLVKYNIFMNKGFSNLKVHNTNDM